GGGGRRGLTRRGGAVGALKGGEQDRRTGGQEGEHSERLRKGARVNPRLGPPAEAGTARPVHGQGRVAARAADDAAVGWLTSAISILPSFTSLLISFPRTAPGTADRSAAGPTASGARTGRRGSDAARVPPAPPRRWRCRFGRVGPRPRRDTRPRCATVRSGCAAASRAACFPGSRSPLAPARCHPLRAWRWQPSRGWGLVRLPTLRRGR